MKAAILIAPDQLELQDSPVPELQPGDALIKVRAAAICGTDIRIYRGRKTVGVRYPSILGHEFSGEVVETGGHAALKSGDRVCLCPFIACGRCALCKSGRENLCTSGFAVGYETDKAGFGADVVICALGKPELARLATQAAAYGGRISLFAEFSKVELAQMDVAIQQAFDMAESGQGIKVAVVDQPI